MSARFQVLVDRTASSGTLPDDLRDTYGGDLCFPESSDTRPFIYTNFVTTLDGLVTFGIPNGSEGRLISMNSRDDHWLMALLRASADAVMVGAGTLRGDPDHAWTVEALTSVDPGPFEAWRETTGRPKFALQCVVTQSGRINVNSRILQRSDLTKIVLTTADGAQRAPAELSNTHILIADGSDGVDLAQAVTLLRQEFGVKRLLCEGGPHLFAQMLKAELVDECFQTLSPQIIGADRSNPHRLSLTETSGFSPEQAKRMHLLSARLGTADPDHLFLRFARS
ncbi:MAG: dihydrofolate reductase family protein [Armatimonadetes bacterium]|nr:dihydrofolate reductase family protein [Armatimonadota bacterium]